ncbi:MAG: hypothetical protein E7104_01745 [Prevotella sp.]|nr:hypothetical protein [Prevotella sp.]
MTKDLNHGICNIEYNCINLPSRVEFLDGSRVLYTYDAKGTKLRTDYYINPMSAVVPQAANEQGASSATNLKHTWTDYYGNFIYENDTLKQTLIEGGYISYEYPQNTAVTSISQLAPTYHFYVQDHLGNNRLVVDEGGTIEQINHYYPFGGLMGESKNISSNQRYKYNGKEFDRMHGLDWYDYGARFHDPATVRWFSVDQLAEKYKGISPYVYCANDPVKHIDPDGRIVKIWYGPKGNEKCFTFTGFHGKKSIRVPNNAFVKAVIKAYVYNAKNGGGKKFIEAAYSKKTIYIDDARLYNGGDDEYKNENSQLTVHWNPDMGIVTTEGGLQSPATQLEHEVDHAIDAATNAHDHNIKNDPGTIIGTGPGYDPQYDTKEERRVITGSEAETAKANGEATRKNHQGTPYRTAGPTTTRLYTPKRR